MSKVITAIFILAAFTACNDNAPSSLQTDLVVLTPGNKIHVYNDELPNTKMGGNTGSRAKMESTLANTESRAPEENIRETAIEEKEIEEAIIKEANMETAPEVAETNEVKEVPVTVSVPAAMPAGNPTSNTSAAIPSINKKDSVKITPAVVPVKKENTGWSNAAKGAVIGGVGGALGGAIISKKKVQGAIVGGVIGAAGGYVLGKTKDNQEANSNSHFAQNK
ncbi:MAG: YMGG-like glycine zipper-containing protein [Ferruginibacter sp.]